MNTCTFLLLCCIASVTGQYQVTDVNGIGRRFDGIGGLSGGGATSKLLVSYAEPQRSEILDLLFKPNYGASLQILKVEIGGDAQTTDGSESSHMRQENEENYNRGYEWWMMKEAKKRNPNIKLSCLPWSFPGWVNDYSTNPDPYKNITKTATYIVNWIKGARDVHNLTIDYVGIWNERPWNNGYIVELRNALNNNGLQSVKIVAPDALPFYDFNYDELADNETVFNSLYAIGVHYPGTQLPENARMSPLALWASEDYSTVNDDVGAGCWARILNQNFVNGNMTSTISWNLISSYYAGLPYPRNGLMDALQPWSGNYVVRNPIWVTAHTTHFTDIGWNYLKQGFGSGRLNGGGSYVGLTNGTDLTIIIETMSHDHSICIRPPLPPYNVTVQHATFMLTGNFANIQKLYVYKSQFRYDNQASRVFERQGDYMITNATIELYLEPDSVYTLSTIYSSGRVQNNNSIPAPSPFPLPYSENFNSYEADNEPKYLAQQNGAWEIVKTSTESFARQKTIHRPIEWCPIPLHGTNAIIGDPSWRFRNIAMSVRVRTPSDGGSQTLFVALKMTGLGCETTLTSALFFWLQASTNQYWISYDIYAIYKAYTGNLSTPFNPDTWHTVSLSMLGRQLAIQVDEDHISWTVPFLANLALTGGYVGVGSADYGYSDWDDLTIEEAKATTTSHPKTTPRPTTSSSSTSSTAQAPTQPSSNGAPSITVDLFLRRMIVVIIASVFFAKLR